MSELKYYNEILHKVRNVGESTIPTGRWFTYLVDYIKDKFPTGTTLNVDTINEHTSDAGVTIDGLLIKDGQTTHVVSGLLDGAPLPFGVVPYNYVVLFDDFLTGVDTGTHWTSLDDSGTGTNTYGNVRGGTLNVLTANADNDYHTMQSASACFNLVDAKELWFEARFRLAEASTNKSAWWFGLCDQVTTGGFQANTSGPLAEYDGVLVWKDEATMTIDVETSNATTQDTEAEIATFVTNTWTRVGFHVSGDATTAIVTAYYDVNDSGVMTAHPTTMNLTRSGLTTVNAIFGVKAGPGNDVETLQVDYIYVAQER